MAELLPRYRTVPSAPVGAGSPLAGLTWPVSPPKSTGIPGRRGTVLGLPGRRGTGHLDHTKATCTAPTFLASELQLQCSTAWDWPRRTGWRTTGSAKTGRHSDTSDGADVTVIGGSGSCVNWEGVVGGRDHGSNQQQVVKDRDGSTQQHNA